MTRERATVIRELGDGLILRRATPADAEALAAFNARIHSDAGPEQPDEKVGAWVRDLLTRPHPTFDPGDFTLVEEAQSGRIVSSLNLISQTWAYEGIPFGVGRPELVGTLPEYRNRGLVRAQFEIIHGWSAERGELVQAITGIPYYYRLFGYEMAMQLGGGRSGYAPQVPRLKEGESEPYRVRPAAVADIPFLQALTAQAAARHVVACVRDEALWRYDIEGRSGTSIINWVPCVIESAEGEPVGYLGHPAYLWPGGPDGTGLGAFQYELKPGAAWLAVTPSVIRYLWQTGEDYAARADKPMQRFVFSLGAEHPVYEACPSRLPSTRPPYAWYIRVPDVPGFLQHVRPALERRLAGSVAAGYSGELKLSFYRRGVRLVLQQGRLETIEPWQPTPADEGSAAFPDLTFLQLLFGHRALDDLRAAFPDCWVNGDETRAVLMGLFPRKPSHFIPVA